MPVDLFCFSFFNSRSTNALETPRNWKVVSVFKFIVSLGFHANLRRGKVFCLRVLATEEKKLQKVFALDLLLSDEL